MLPFTFLISLSCFSLVLSIPILESPEDDLLIWTKYGPVQGFSQDGADVWHGIPFAKPPVGQNRFKPPQTPDSWDNPILCDTPAPKCSQVDVANLFVEGSEDCLYIDVYRPAGHTGPLPVLFWIYGGGYTGGDNYEDGRFDGTNRVTEFPVIIVAANYRLNAFGFLGLEELLEESGSTGNYGVQDQRFALQWVQQNIALFGGDPNQVTIFGQSAGAFSICYQLSSPASVGLFRAAIMESGTCDSPEFFMQLRDVDSWSADVASWAGCNRSVLSHEEFMFCLRNTSEADWMYTTLSWFTGKWDQSGTGFRPLLAPVMPWGPTIDGTESGLPEVPLELIRQGRGSHVPFLAGTNADEGTEFIPGFPLIIPGVDFPLDEDELILGLEHFFPDSNQTVDDIIALYPVQNYHSVSDQAAAILRDYFFTCPTRRGLRAILGLGLPTWEYFFTYIYQDPSYAVLGDSHGSEVNYVWNNHLQNKTNRDEAMQESLGFYWTNMAIYKDPNGLGSPDQTTWPKYQPASDNYLDLGTPCIPKKNLMTETCDFWDTVS